MSDTNELEHANPTDVDKGPVMGIGGCPNCGPHSLATVRVEDAIYISSCGMCEYEKRAPVVVGEDGEPKVDAGAVTEYGIEDQEADEP